MPAPDDTEIAALLKSIDMAAFRSEAEARVLLACERAGVEPVRETADPNTASYGPGMDHTGALNYSLPPRGVAFGKPDPGMRNHDCRVDGHSFDGGLCIYCDTRADPPWEGSGKGIFMWGEDKNGR